MDQRNENYLNPTLTLNPKTAFATAFIYVLIVLIDIYLRICSF